MKSLKKEALSKLSISTAIDLFHLINEFGKVHNIEDKLTVYLADDQPQEDDTDTCGIFELYFYTNLFKPLPISSLISDTRLNRKTIENYLMKYLH